MHIINETFKIESARSQIEFSTKFSHAKWLKVNKLTYNTASANNYNMIIIVSGWTDHRYNPTGQPYTYLQNLPRTTLTEVDYEAHVDHWDVKKSSSEYLGIVGLECYINGDSTDTDISPVNPLYIEFSIMTE